MQEETVREYEKDENKKVDKNEKFALLLWEDGNFFQMGLVFKGTLLN